MVSKLHRFKSYRSFKRWVIKGLGFNESVAKRSWKGPGYYYHRGKGYIVKYSSARDKKYGGKVGYGPWRHTHDLPRRVVLKLRKAVVRHARRHVKGKKHRDVRAKHVVARAVKYVRKERRNKEVDRIARYLWREIPERYKSGKRKIWTYVAVMALAREIYEQSKRKGIDWRNIDWAQEIDWGAGYRSAEKRVYKILGSPQAEYDEEDIKRIEREWSKVRRDLKLPETIEPWELKALFT